MSAKCQKYRLGPQKARRRPPVAPTRIRDQLRLYLRCTEIPVSCFMLNDFLKLSTRLFESLRFLVEILPGVFLRKKPCKYGLYGELIRAHAGKFIPCERRRHGSAVSRPHCKRWHGGLRILITSNIHIDAISTLCFS